MFEIYIYVTAMHVLYVVCIYELCPDQLNIRAIHLFLIYNFSPRGVGRSRRYCNTGPTRGEVGASPRIFSQVQKSV